jgi:hypothetical protein
MTNGTPPSPLEPSSIVVQRQIIGAFSAVNISRIFCAVREIFTIKFRVVPSHILCPVRFLPY